MGCVGGMASPASPPPGSPVAHATSLAPPGQALVQLVQTMVTAMAGTDFGEFGHFLTMVQPFSVAVSGLEVTVQFLLGG